MKQLKLILIAGLALTACSKPVTKKVLVMGRGSLKANGTDITVKDGSGYAEATVEVAGEEPATLNINAADKSTTSVPADKGFYLLNLRNDTVVGSRQNINSDLANRTVSQEELRHKIDSLTLLTTGANVSNGGINFIVPPKQLVKVSGNMEAQVFGPFNKIPAELNVDKDGNPPEIYKFYTNNEIRELIASLKKLTY